MCVPILKGAGFRSFNRHMDKSGKGFPALNNLFFRSENKSEKRL
jgi:hypothetical protein